MGRRNSTVPSVTTGCLFLWGPLPEGECCRSRQRQRLGRQSSAQDLLARVNAVDDSKALPTPFRRFRDIIRNSLEPLVQGAAGLCTEQVAGHSSLELHAHRAGAGWQVLLLAGPEGCGRDWWSVSLSGFGPLPVVSSGNDSNRSGRAHV